ncbi:helix-turn-helix domain-containing protein [Streptomyces sp. NPDC086777]|uniref:TetR/AcrR family transcriptional regulator n=1 Tax=Streptomyces sp. NPDC086777 TaxID=3154866 RepID=UPI00344DACFE
MTSGGVRLRADAARNREGITRAARALIMARGSSVEMDEIAREAGVAVGTIYRHFPAKNQLLEAILTELGQEISTTHSEAVNRVTAGRSDGWTELAGLLRRAVVDIKEERLLRELTLTDGPCLPPEVQSHAESTIAFLVASAHEDGDLRADVTANDLTLLLTNSPGPQTPTTDRERWLTLALRALAAPHRCPPGQQEAPPASG